VSLLDEGEPPLREGGGRECIPRIACTKALIQWGDYNDLGLTRAHTVQQGQARDQFRKPKYEGAHIPCQNFNFFPSKAGKVLKTFNSE